IANKVVRVHEHHTHKRTSALYADVTSNVNQYFCEPSALVRTPEKTRTNPAQARPPLPRNAGPQGLLVELARLRRPLRELSAELNRPVQRRLQDPLTELSRRRLRSPPHAVAGEIREVDGKIDESAGRTRCL